MIARQVLLKCALSSDKGTKPLDVAPRYQLSGDNMTNEYVAYYRVSTERQGQSGLGLDAQRKAVMDHLNGGTLLDTFTEVESGRKNDRPELAKALDLCHRRKAAARHCRRAERQGY